MFLDFQEKKIPLLDGLVIGRADLIEYDSYISKNQLAFNLDPPMVTRLGPNNSFLNNQLLPRHEKVPMKDKDVIALKKDGVEITVRLLQTPKKQGLNPKMGTPEHLHMPRTLRFNQSDSESELEEGDLSDESSFIYGSGEDLPNTDMDTSCPPDSPIKRKTSPIEDTYELFAKRRRLELQELYPEKSRLQITRLLKKEYQSQT